MVGSGKKFVMDEFAIPADEQARMVAGERRRRDRWWDTYNAAMTGLLSKLSVYEVHDFARKAADKAHGPVKGKNDDGQD